MKRFLRVCALVLLAGASPLVAQLFGSASGHGTLERSTGRPGSTAPTQEQVSFSPRYSSAFGEGSGADRMTWIVFTEKEPAVAAWAKAGDFLDTLRLWCANEKASFVAVEVNAEAGAEYFFLCPGDGRVESKGVNVANGLVSVVVTLDRRDPKRVKGTLRAGEGSCPDARGKQDYCSDKQDYAFDAPISK